MGLGVLLRDTSTLKAGRICWGSNQQPFGCITTLVLPPVTGVVKEQKLRKRRRRRGGRRKETRLWRGRRSWRSINISTRETGRITIGRTGRPCAQKNLWFHVHQTRQLGKGDDSSFVLKYPLGEFSI